VRLSAARVQAFLTGQLTAGQSVRNVQIMKTVLSSALTRAMREELVMRNVARLAELPAWERQIITPWAAAEARAFLDAANDDPLYPAFVLLLLYGLRRGEVLGLRWRDVDQADGAIHIRQQILRARRVLRFGQVKTAAGRRDLPMLPLAADVVAARAETQAADRELFGRPWESAHGLVFTTRTGHPVEPRNLVRSLSPHLLGSRAAPHCGPPSAPYNRDSSQEPWRSRSRRAADPGHARMAITLEIYTHEDREAQCQALTKFSDTLRQDGGKRL
jgi:integrase